MKQIGISIATIVFFALAIVGWASGVAPLLCGLRALAGAVAIYVMSIFVDRIVIRILAEPSSGTGNDEISDGKEQRES